MTPAEIAAFERDGGAEVAGISLTTSDVRVCSSLICTERYHIIIVFKGFTQGRHDDFNQLRVQKQCASKPVWMLVTRARRTQCTTQCALI